MIDKTQTSALQTFKDIFKNRPTVPIIIICLFETFGLILLPSAITSEKSAAIGLWYQIYVALTGFLSIAIIYSLWKMKKIGIWIYTGAYVIHNIVAVIAGNWVMGIVIIPCIGLGLIGLSYKKLK